MHAYKSTELPRQFSTFIEKAVLALLTSDSRFCTQHQFDIHARHTMSGPKVTEFNQMPGGPSPSLVAVADVQQITDQASSRDILYKIG